jgi:hypothetical protein
MNTYEVGNTYHLPIGQLTRPLIEAHERDGTTRYKFNLLDDTRPAVVWMTRAQLDTVNPQVQPTFAIVDVWLGICNGILEQGKRMIDIRELVAESQLEAAA